MTKADPKTAPVKNPQEKTGWNLMLSGFAILILAGIALYGRPSEGFPYHRAGNYLTGLGFAVYLTGRIIRAKGRRQREKEEEK